MARPPFQNEHNYAAVQEVMRHDDAVHYYGEMTAFILWWDTTDLTNGLVRRCTTCFDAYVDIASAYGQGSKRKCAECYGTTFSGGYRAIIFRPALWSIDGVSDEIHKKSGTILSISANVDTTSDFSMRQGDIMVRGDGTRWLCSQPKSREITTGFGMTGDNGALVRNQLSAVLEEESQVAYDVQIDLSRFRSTAGWKPYMLYPDSDIFSPNGYLDTPPNLVGGTAFYAPNGVINGGTPTNTSTELIDGGTP